MYRLKNFIKTKYKVAHHRLDRQIGAILGNSVNAYWFDSVPNFGDQLNKSLLSYYGFTPILTPKNDAEIVAIGSVLDNLSEDFSGIILGSGLMNDIQKSFPNARVLALRGKLTRDRIICNDNVILGDPGLLADRLVSKHHRKQYLIGFIPHYVDKQNEKVVEIKRNFQGVINVIDVQKSPVYVLSEVDKCCFILSSSLHGVIAADALGIPNGWLVLSDKVHGNGFKFHDYFSAIKMDVDPSILKGQETLEELCKKTHPVSKQISAIKDNLERQFVLLKTILKTNT